MAGRTFHDMARGSLRVLCTYMFIALMFLLSLANIPLLGAGIVRPAFLLIALYFWTITRPSLLPLPAVFAIGFLYDIASDSVPGLHTFAFMVITVLVRSQRRYLLAQPWPVLWVGFVIAALILNAVQAVVYIASSGAMPSLWLVFANVVVSSLAYPVLAPAMIALNRFLTVAKHHYT